TEDGRMGLGNAGLCPDVTRQIVDAKLAPLLLGENPLNTEYLFEKMYRSTVAFGRKGAALAAISAVDIALWDIKGQAMGQPVFVGAGGGVRGPPFRRTIAGCTRAISIDCSRRPRIARRPAFAA